VRILHAEVAAETLRDGGARLRMKTATGEEIATDLSPERATQLRDDLNSVLGVEPDTEEHPSKPRRGRKA
jgi:hypothetical protein